MAENSGYTKKTKDWLGRDVEKHFDKDGKPTGETRFSTDWAGRPIQVHVDPEGKKTGETKKDTDFIGRDRAVHVNDQKETIGYSRDEKDWIGNPVQRHYKNSGEPVGESRIGRDWLGRKQREHEGRYFKSGEQSDEASKNGSYYGGSGAGSPRAIAASGTGKGWLIVGALAAVAIIAYGLGQQNGVTNVGSTGPAPSGVPVYNLQCGQTFDVQIPPPVRRAFFIVPPCKCSDLSELNYDCTGWVRIMEPNSHFEMVMRNADGVMANECIVLYEYSKGRGPVGVPPGKPIKVAGCGGAANPEMALFRTKDVPQGMSLLIPDRFTIQNIQQYPIRVSIDFP
jgi:hypothetical protein